MFWILVGIAFIVGATLSGIAEIIRAIKRK